MSASAGLQFALRSCAGVSVQGSLNLKSVVEAHYFACRQRRGTDDIEEKDAMNARKGSLRGVCER